MIVTDDQLRAYAEILRSEDSTFFILGQLRELRNKYEARFVGMSKELNEVEQTLGAALGYPRYCDDQANFPGTTETDGVCVGEHTAGTLAQEAADRLSSLTMQNQQLITWNKRAQEQNEQLKTATARLTPQPAESGEVRDA